MAPAASASKAAGTKATKPAAKSKAATTKAATATTPKKSRKRAADAMEEPAPPKMDEPVKQAKKDAAKKAKAKAKKEEEPAPATAVVEVASPPKAKKAKTTKASELAAAAAAATTTATTAAAVKAEEKDAKPAKTTKKAAPKKDAGSTEAKPKKAASKAKDATTTDGAAKPKKRKAATLEDGEPKAKPASAGGAKKLKVDEHEESQSLLGLVGASLQAASKRMSGLFTVLASGDEGANGTTPATKKKAAPKKSSSTKAKATPSGEDTAVGSHAHAAHEQADSDSDLQDDDPAAALLQGFASSDEEAASGDEGFGPGKPLPKLPKRKGLAKRLQGAAAAPAEPGVVYIGRIPHGFHEHEMRAYFSQFGTVEHVRLSRSKKTGASKHYAFLQFASADVARIAAETMNNYLMFGHILKCHVVPPEQVHPSLWIGADRRFKAVPWNQLAGRKLAQPKGRSAWQDAVAAEAERRTSKTQKLAATMGYDFAPPVLKSPASVPARTLSTTVVTAADDSTVVEAVATDVKVLPPADDVVPAKGKGKGKGKAKASGDAK